MDVPHYVCSLFLYDDFHKSHEQQYGQPHFPDTRNHNGHYHHRILHLAEHKDVQMFWKRNRLRNWCDYPSHHLLPDSRIRKRTVQQGRLKITAAGKYPTRFAACRVF